MTDTAPKESISQTSALRSVAMPSEHGGWGLTLEPGLLGLLVAPSAAGACLAAAAMVAFTVRTPAKIAFIDLRRGRRLARTKLAAGVAVVEFTLLIALIAGALVLADGPFWVPLVVAAPLIILEASFETRSRGRRLVPELAGAIGVCSVAAMVVLADDGSWRLALALWFVLAARVLTSIPFVRTQIARLHNRPLDSGEATVGDLSALVAAVCAVWLDTRLIVGALAVLAVVILQRMSAQRPVPRPAVIGMRQMAMGLGVVIFAALGVSVL